ncbi:MAG: hypothetical protein Greene041619_512 [Candidatus Peregrinibacteria bacterium Greene0416_19]|nr:MAG: hypothetical protein Greene041619_512 [Candidatus Peregrinibacteria bacterium Greene0416_19]
MCVFYLTLTLSAPWRGDVCVLFCVCSLFNFEKKTQTFPLLQRGEGEGEVTNKNNTFVNHFFIA